jgi:hypothetical protein
MSEAAPCRNPDCVRYNADGPHAHCRRCGRPAHPDHRCNYCGLVVCIFCSSDMPLTDIPILDEDYETMCDRCCKRELGVFMNLAFLEDLTVLPCGHSVVHLHIPNQGNASCRACSARTGMVPDAFP